MNTRSSLLAFCAATLLLVSWPARAATPGWLGGNTVKGNGVVKTQPREVSGFTGIAVGLAAQVEVRQGAAEGVTIETDENLLPLIETMVERGVLRIRTADRDVEIQPRTLKIVVQARQVDRLSLGGSGSITADALRSPKLQAEIGGSGSIDIRRLESDDAVASIGGSGNVKLAGTANKFSVSIGGSGSVMAGQLKSQQVNVEIGGSGEAVVFASQSLHASIAGSGDVKYYGDAKVNMAVAGSGRVKHLAPAP